jgi:hypothetical protein
VLVEKGKNKTEAAKLLDSALYASGWVEKSFDTKINVDGVEEPTPTHSVDCFKNRVALEVEWNNKDPFLGRDLKNFRLLYVLRVIDLGRFAIKWNPVDRRKRPEILSLEQTPRA